MNNENCIRPLATPATAYTNWKCRCVRCLSWARNERMAARNNGRKRAAATIESSDHHRYKLPTLAPSRAEGWRSLAACEGVDPAVFYTETDDEADEAKAICAVCPVRAECLNHAIANREREGVWGGLTAWERRQEIRRRRGRPADVTVTAGMACGELCGTVAGHKRHWRVGEVPCSACRDANRIAAADYKARLHA